MNEHELYVDRLRMEVAINKLEELKEHTERNMKALNNMMLELKGLIGMVRAKAGRPGMEWYGKEISTEALKDSVHIEDLTINDIELKK